MVEDRFCDFYKDIASRRGRAKDRGCRENLGL